jgi:hypothetical protein
MPERIMADEEAARDVCITILVMTSACVVTKAVSFLGLEVQTDHRDEVDRNAH